MNATPYGTDPETAQIILGLVVSDLFMIGLERANAHRTTFVDCDEAQEWAPPDFGATLDLVLSSGLQFTTIHHYEGQMDARSQQSLSVNAGIKYVFGGLSADIRKKIAENAFPEEVNQDWHRQPRTSLRPTYIYEEMQSVTDRDDGSKSVTRSPQVRAEYEEVESGWDDYGRDEKLSRLAARFLLPKRECYVVLPDKSYRFKVPDLDPYLYDSRDCLSFRQSLPKSISLDEADRHNAERSTRVTADRAKKKPARLCDAE